MAISMAYGVFDEGHQYFVPGRTASLMDMGLNLAGVVLGTLGYFSADRWLRKAEN
jgi:VanZ family protein